MTQSLHHIQDWLRERIGRLGWQAVSDEARLNIVSLDWLLRTQKVNRAFLRYMRRYHAEHEGGTPPSVGKDADTLKHMVDQMDEEHFGPAARRFYDADLHGLEMPNTDLSHFVLNDCDMQEAWLPNCTMTQAFLREANLEGANLGACGMQGADLSGANLREAGMALLNGSNAIFRGADMRDAVLTVGLLCGADLRDARLEGADLRYADLRGARIDGASFDGARLHRAALPDGMHLEEAEW